MNRHKTISSKYLPEVPFVSCFFHEFALAMTAQKDQSLCSLGSFSLLSRLGVEATRSWSLPVHSLKNRPFGPLLCFFRLFFFLRLLQTLLLSRFLLLSLLLVLLVLVLILRCVSFAALLLAIGRLVNAVRKHTTACRYTLGKSDAGFVSIGSCALEFHILLKFLIFWNVGI